MSNSRRVHSDVYEKRCMKLCEEDATNCGRTGKYTNHVMLIRARMYAIALRRVKEKDGKVAFLETRKDRSSDEQHALRASAV